MTITERQREVYDAIVDGWLLGKPRTIHELMKVLKITSPAAFYGHVDGLKRAGLVVSTETKSRSLRPSGPVVKVIDGRVWSYGAPTVDEVLRAIAADTRHTQFPGDLAQVVVPCLHGPEWSCDVLNA